VFLQRSKFARGEVAMKDQDGALMRLAARVGRSLGERGQVVTTAESCTGGWIAKALTDVPGSSQWFGEGFVTYSNDAKVRSLGVSRAALKREGAVSAAVARAMAQGALRRTEAELAVAVTGIAGPEGAVPGKPVGTVWFCWAQRVAGRTRFLVERKRFRGGRDAVRRSTVRHALRRLAALEGARRVARRLSRNLLRAN
jgi:nicotinamide-nucleotide amidase